MTLKVSAAAAETSVRSIIDGAFVARSFLCCRNEPGGNGATALGASALFVDGFIESAF
jgi:hypothetical protein